MSRKTLVNLIREMLAGDESPINISVSNYPISVEIASSPESRSRGLMHRDSLDPDCGMLFCFEDPAVASFWMKQTKVPLSIAFIGDDGCIQQIEDLQPHDERVISSSAPCKWALEANQGWFKDRGIRIGDRIRGLPIIQPGVQF